MAYGDFKDLKKRAAVDKIFRDKAFNIPKNPKYDGYQRGLASMGIFFNWYSLRARLNSHYKAWSYKKRKHAQKG